MGCSGFKPNPAPLNYLKKVLPLTTQYVCVCMDTIFYVIACDCVVCVFVMIPLVPGRVASG